MRTDVYPLGLCRITLVGLVLFAAGAFGSMLAAALHSVAWFVGLTPVLGVGLALLYVAIICAEAYQRQVADGSASGTVRSGSTGIAQDP